MPYAIPRVWLQVVIDGKGQEKKRSYERENAYDDALYVLSRQLGLLLWSLTLAWCPRSRMKKKRYGHARFEGARFEIRVYEGRFGIGICYLGQIQHLRGDLQKWLRAGGERISTGYGNAFGSVFVRGLCLHLRHHCSSPVQTDEVGHGMYLQAEMIREVRMDLRICFVPGHVMHGRVN